MTVTTETARFGGPQDAALQSEEATPTMSEELALDTMEEYIAALLRGGD